MSALQAVHRRTSWSKVTEDAPTRAELLELVAAAGRVADHSALRPWRLIELRGEDRRVLGAALAEAAGDDKPSTKPLRAALLIAIVASYRDSGKVPRWEQEAVASGVAHTLSLLLDEAGWGVIWRTGALTRSEPVARVHGLGEHEELLGWLYVGGRPEGRDPGRRKPVDAETLLCRFPSGDDGTRRADAAEDAGTDGGRLVGGEQCGAQTPRTAMDEAAEKAVRAARKAEVAAERAERAAAGLERR